MLAECTLVNYVNFAHYANYTIFVNYAYFVRASGKEIYDHVPQTNG